MCRYQNIEFTDRRAAFGENVPDSPELKGGIPAKIDDFDSGREGIDETMEFARAFSVSTKSQLGEGDSADAQVRRFVRSDASRDLALAAQGVANGIRVEEILHRPSRGFLRVEIERA
jgi:hypothetical protein